MKCDTFTVVYKRERNFSNLFFLLINKRKEKNNKNKKR